MMLTSQFMMALKNDLISIIILISSINLLLVRALDPTWQPWDYSWDDFPSLYFAANPEDDFSTSQLQKLSKFKLVIIEYRQSQFLGEVTGSGKWADGDEGAKASSQCQMLKEWCDNNNVVSCPPCLTYRSGEWAGTMYPSQEEHMRSNQNLYLTSTFDCDGFTDYPLDIINEPPNDSGIERCRPDFRLQGARDFYVKTVIEENVANDSNVDGVFIDNGQSVACDNEEESSDLSFNERRQYQRDQLDAYKEAFLILNNAGKYPILSTTNRYASVDTPLVPWGSDCPDAEDITVSSLHDEGIAFARNNEFFMWNLGSTCATQLQNSLLEATSGVPLIVHTPYFRSGKGCLEGCFNDNDDRINFNSMSEFLEFSIAAFLVVAGHGSFFGFSDMEDPEDEFGLGGWADSSWPFFSQYDSIKTGSPLAEASASNNGRRYTREYEKMTIMVDCDTGEYSLTTKSSSPTPSYVTVDPTPSPIKSPSVEVPTSPVAPSSCVDFEGRIRFSKNGKKITRSCTWANNKDTDIRCTFKGVSASCPVTCDTCSSCVDPDNSLKFKFFWSAADKNIGRTCAWVAKKQTPARCAASSNICRSTCDAC